MPRKLNTEEFIKKARKTHGPIYNYDQTVYLGYHKNIIVNCETHGDFSVRADHHIEGQGCPVCLQEYRKLTLENFIERANFIHNNKYSYENSEYVNFHTKIKILCPVHEVFEQTPASHLQGHGCPTCGNTKKLTHDDFVRKANESHFDKYDYSEVNYINYETKVKIICPVHGEFWQTPSNHIFSHGCPKCTSQESPQELKIRKKLDDIGIKYFHNKIIDKRYPWHVDIYIPERDLFLEYNGFWVHQPKLGWYSSSSKEHKNTRLIFEKNYPDWSPLAWWTSDVKKRKTAKKNNLNYIVLWNEQDIEDWFALGCPNGHDGNGMYTWKK